MDDTLAPAADATDAPDTRPTVDPRIDDALERWRDAGLVGDDEVEAIRAFERGGHEPSDGDAGPPPPPPDEDGLLPEGRAGLLAEGLAYVGAALAFGAGATLFAELWNDLSGVARTLVAAAGTMALGGAAAALAGPTSDAVRRLRTLLWALAAVGVGLTVGIGLVELVDTSGAVARTTGGAAALVAAAAVHRRRPSWPTALVAGGALLLFLLSGEELLGLDSSEVAAGVTVAAVGLAWASLGWAGWLRPRSAFEVTGLLAGGVGIQVLAFDAYPLTALAVGLLVSAGAVAVGMVEERTSPAVLGGLGVTVFAPQVVFELFGETIGGPLALFVAGLTLVAVAVLVLRQRSEQ